MRLPNDDDPELVALVERFVQPGGRYLELLHGNFLGRGIEERTAFISALVRDSQNIADSELEVLLASEWRSCLTASWLIAASKRSRFIDQVGGLLLASELVYAGQGFCIALGSIDGNRSTEHLVDYLHRWLPETECRYDQMWAMATFVHLDPAEADRFLATGGLWQQWTRDPTGLDSGIELVRDLLSAISQ